MNQSLAARITVLASYLPNHCPGCRDWPAFSIRGDADPDPPARCDLCGRQPPRTPIVLIGIDPVEI